ncbi:MAG TPA: hypothetical protein VFX98_13585, partial [Longimicrobiaceae bacterium]|nr:hypothetical protein [Longimicrobiaceae bacterium]
MPERTGTERRSAPRGTRERRRPPRLRHHGLRVAVLLAASVLVYLLFPGAQGPGVTALERGVVAPRDVVAQFPFDVLKSDEELRREREEAARGVPPVHDFAPGAADSVVAGLEGFFGALEAALSAAPPEDAAQAVRGVLQAHRVPATLGAVEVLADPARRQALRAAARAAVDEHFPAGVAAASPGRAGISAVRVRGIPGGERLVSADSLLTADQFFRLAAERLPPDAG